MTQNEYNSTLKALQEAQEFYNIQRKADYMAIQETRLAIDQEIETLRLRRSQLEARSIRHRAETKERNRQFRADMTALIQLHPDLAEARRAEREERREACRQAREEAKL